MKKQKSSGITLIALIITIIVLLILASVSVATLVGENGIITKANETKTATEIANIIERAKIDIMEIQLEKGGELAKEDLDGILKSYDKDGTIKIEDEGNRYIVTSEDYKIMVVDIWSEEKPVIFAKNVLKADSTATDVVSKSPYVMYNNLLCRVLYNDDTHGIQIITTKSVESVSLGPNDKMVTTLDFSYGDGEYETGSIARNDAFKKAAASYNNAVDNLNNKAKSYMDSNGIATDARCLGSIATLNNDLKFQGDTSGMWSDTYEFLTTYGLNNKFKTSDTNYLEDVDQVNSLELGIESWLCSRYLQTSDSGAYNLIIRYLNKSGKVATAYLAYGWNDGSGKGVGSPGDFVPVFLLKSNVTINGGNGTSENPYILGESV